MVENVEFLREGAVPFAMRTCEKLPVYPVTGYYDSKSRTWVGDICAATLTVTASSVGQDADLD